MPAVAAVDSAGRNTRTSQATAPDRHPEVHPDVPTLEEMATQMNELGAGLEALKEKAAADEATIGDLRRDLKRTDRLKSSYKRQVGELTSMLEEKGRVGSRVLSNQDESAALQRSTSLDQQQQQRRSVSSSLERFEERRSLRRTGSLESGGGSGSDRSGDEGGGGDARGKGHYD